MFKQLTIIDISELSATTGIGNVLEAKVTKFDDLIIVLRMEDEDMLSVRSLNRIVDYFGASLEDVILNSTEKGNLEINVMGQTYFKYDEINQVVPEPEAYPPSEGYACCGTGGCPGCPSARK